MLTVESNSPSFSNPANNEAFRHLGSQPSRLSIYGRRYDAAQPMFREMASAGKAGCAPPVRFGDDMRIARSPSRRLVAIVLIAILLISRIAVAAYVCPELRTAFSSADTHAQNALETDCPHLSVEFPSLCEAHCEPDSQRAHSAEVPAVRGFIASELWVVAWDARIAPLLLCAPTRFAAILQRSTAPPLAVSHCCFRI